jgi:parvulin-like peptidyl-prolyl isomerase
MRLFWVLMVLMAAVVDASPAGKNPAQTSLPAGVAATVNGTAIPESVVRAFVADDQKAFAGEDQPNAGKMRKTAIDQMIDRILIEQECKARGILPTDADIRSDEERMIREMSGEKGFSDFLKQGHFSRDQYREYVLKTSAANAALLADMTKSIKATPAEIADYYRLHSKAFQRPEFLAGAQIFFDMRPTFLRDRIKSSSHLNDGPELDRAVTDEITRQQQLADEVRREAMEAGSDFSALARQYSDDATTREKGGSVDIIKKPMPSSGLDAAFSRLQPGEVGPVVKTDRGFYVIKLLGSKPATLQSLDEATPSIQQRLAQPKAAEALNSWLTQARAKAVIVRKDN